MATQAVAVAAGLAAALGHAGRDVAEALAETPADLPRVLRDLAVAKMEAEAEQR